MGWFKWLLLLLIIAVALLVWYCRPRPSVATTRLELESVRGVCLRADAERAQG